MKITIEIKGKYCEIKEGVNCQFLFSKLYDFKCKRFNSPLVSDYIARRDTFVGMRCDYCLALDKKETENEGGE